MILALALAAVLLSLERITYAVVWRHPDHFASLCERRAPARLRDPVAALRALFCGFKAIQALVFAGSIASYGVSFDPHPWTIGALLIAAGQTLNLAVFHRLGAVGVFYGSRFGRAVPWVHGFPFSVLAHPQYVGTVVTIWGLFLATRFPDPDWIALPLLETLYYAIGARLERAPAELADDETTRPEAVLAESV